MSPHATPGDAPLLRLLAGFPVAVVEAPGEGRCLVAARALCQGELLLASQPFGRVIAAPARRRWCAQCHGLSAREPLRVACRGACGAAFCSQRCRERAAGRHTEDACRARALLRIGRGSGAAAAAAGETQPSPPLPPPLHALDGECTQLALLLLDCATHHAAQLAGCDDAGGAAAEPGAPLALPPTLADVAAMYTPPTDALDAAGLTVWPAKWAAVAAAVQAAALAACGAAACPPAAALALLGGLDAAALASLASKDLSNSFGLWDRGGACVEALHRSGGYALFPSASLFNHSCVPNVFHEHTRTPAGGGLLVFRALCDVAAGEALNIRYVDPSGGDAERRAAFTGTWGFACACARCERGGDDADVAAWDAAFLCGCGYGRPHAGPGPGRPRRRPRDCACPQPWLLPPREARPAAAAAGDVVVAVA
jgi:hypothetical protein